MGLFLIFSLCLIGETQYNYTNAIIYERESFHHNTHKEFIILRQGRQPFLIFLAPKISEVNPSFGFSPYLLTLFSDTLFSDKFLWGTSSRHFDITLHYPVRNAIQPFKEYELQTSWFITLSLVFVLITYQ